MEDELLTIGRFARLCRLSERGLRPQAPVREAYLVGPAEAPQDELMTRLMIPAEESTAWPR